jgi:hypothetical protein
MCKVFWRFDCASQLMTAHGILDSSVLPKNPKLKAFGPMPEYDAHGQPAGGPER